MPTATDPTDPHDVHAQLERLKQGISAAAEAERELGTNRKARNLKLAQEITRREEADAAAYTARLADLSAAHQAAVDRREWLYQRRKDHLPRAYHASRASLAKRLEEKKARAVGKVRGSILIDRKKLQGALAEAVEDHRSVMTDLLADRETMRQLKDYTLNTYRTHRLLLEPLFGGKPAGRPVAGDPRAECLEQIATARLLAERARTQPLAAVFRKIPVWLFMAAITLLLGAFLGRTSPVLLLPLALVLPVWLAVLAMAYPPVSRIATALRLAREASRDAERASAAAAAALQEELDQHEKQHNEGLTQTFQEADQETQELLAKGQADLQQRLAALPDRMLDMHRRRLRRLDRKYQEETAKIRAEAEETAKTRKLARAAAASAAESVMESAIAELAVSWKSGVAGIAEDLSERENSSRLAFPGWTAESIAAWSPADSVPRAIRIGSLHVRPATLPGGIPASPLLSLPGDGTFNAPLSLAFPQAGSLLIETEGDATRAVEALNAISIRILASLPPGRASFVFLDPVGLGRGFAGLMHLADYEESLIHHRIWTQTGQMEERLAELNEHIEKVIQMYLRNEFATLADYNAQAGAIAEKYRFLVIAGYPSGFSETAAKRLLSIAASGARCGVHILLQRDMRQPAVDPALDDELRRACLRVTQDGGGFLIGTEEATFDPAPSDENASALIHKIGRAAMDSNRVEVPFSEIAPPEDSLWSLDLSEELRVPIGRTGAKKLQMLALGKGTRQHALVAGKTGSGKSTLFHVIITNLSLWSSPRQVEFYLVDFKKGVEFKCYADRKLPHAKVVAIESDRGFALSVLQRVDAELKRRGELYRKAGAQDLAGYNRSGETPLPRTLLLIDEFQEFFTEDDSVAQQASLLLDRIVRQGRAFGIHVILGSQTLGGAYTLARATLGQMAVRIALQCNEADAHLIMDEENPAPRMLTRPGEGIYNDQSGSIAANSPFQIVWLSERGRDEVLEKIGGLARRNPGTPSAPIVFEGNAPADIRENPELAAALSSPATARPATAHAWLGAPNSIKGPTAATFRRHSGSNLLVVSQAPEQADSMLACSMLSLASQYPADQASFVILDPEAADESSGDSLLLQVARRLPHPVRMGGLPETADLMASLAAEAEGRAASSGKGAPEIFLIIRDLQRFRSLRPDDEFRFSYDDAPAAISPPQALAALLADGGPCGLHVIISIDTWNNTSRWLPRKLMAEFENRVLFQMSANDSSNLIDTPDASSLGLHRALLHNEHMGAMEIFRPYASPESAWIREASAALAPAVPSLDRLKSV